MRADGNVMKPLFSQTVKGKSTPLSIKDISSISKQAMEKAGVPSHFTPRSLRSAASSAAIDDGVPMERVLMQGRWSSKEMFKKFYYRATGRSRKKKKLKLHDCLRL